MEILTVIAILTGPIIAVTITLWIENMNKKNKAKHDLFISLLATRKTLPVPPRFVDSLNTIDVVFHGCDNVIKSWKELYVVLHTEPFDADNYNRKLLNLLDSMAKNRGYKNIKQTDFDEFYNPKQFASDAAFQNELSSELLRVLKNSENYGTPKR